MNSEARWGCALVVYVLAVVTLVTTAGFVFGALLALVTGGSPAVMGALCAGAVVLGIVVAWATDKG